MSIPLEPVTGPQPPNVVELAAGTIAEYGRAGVDVFLGLVTNGWVLAIFALGVALAFAGGVVGRARRATGRSVG